MKLLMGQQSQLHQLRSSQSHFENIAIQQNFEQRQTEQYIGLYFVLKIEQLFRQIQIGIYESRPQEPELEVRNLCLKFGNDFRVKYVVIFGYQTNANSC